MTPKALTTVLATLAILAASFILSLVVSRRGKKAPTGDATDDWNIGGRSLPLFVVIGTQFASAMGGGVLGVFQHGAGTQLFIIMYHPLPTFLTKLTSQSRTFPIVPMSSVTGRPRGYAWCGGSLWGSPRGQGRLLVSSRIQKFKKTLIYQGLPDFRQN